MGKYNRKEWVSNKQLDVRVSVSRESPPANKNIRLEQMEKNAQEAAIKKVIQRIDSHFDTRQAVWESLAPYTQADRKARGFDPNYPKLIRTGDLRRNRAVTFAFIKELPQSGKFNNVDIIVGTKDKPAIDLNNGNRALHLPPRNFYRMDDEDIREIRNAYAQNFRQSLLKSTTKISKPARAGTKSLGAAKKKIDKYKKQHRDGDLPASVRTKLHHTNLATEQNLNKYASQTTRERYQNASPDERREMQYETNKEIHRNRELEHEKNKVEKEIRERKRRDALDAEVQRKVNREQEIAGKKRKTAEAEERGEQPFRDVKKYGNSVEEVIQPRFDLNHHSQLSKKDYHAPGTDEVKPFFRSQYQPYKRKKVILQYGSRRLNKPLRPKDFTTKEAYGLFQEIHKSYPKFKPQDLLDALEFQRAEDMHQSGLISNEGYDTIVRNVLANRKFRAGKKGRYASHILNRGKENFIKPKYLREEQKKIVIRRAPQNFNMSASTDASDDALRSKDLSSKTVFIGKEVSGWLDSLWNHHNVKGRGNFEFGKSSMGAAKPDADREARARSKARSRGTDLSMAKTVEYLKGLEELEGIVSKEDFEKYMPSLQDKGIEHTEWTVKDRKRANESNQSYRQARENVDINNKTWNRKPDKGD